MNNPPPTLMQLAIEFINLPALARNLARRHELIVTLTWRDFRARFLGTFGGIFWAVIQPLIMMTVYTLIFSTILGVKFGNTDSPFTFAVYLLCGMLPWTAFSEAFGASTGLVRANTNLVKRVVFPLEVLPLNLALAGAIQQVIGFLLLIPLAWIVSGKLYPTILFFPIIMIPQLLISCGIYWLWASLSVFFPDLRNLTVLLTSVLTFLTPIFYPLTLVPEKFRIILYLNPFTYLVTMYRQVFMDGVLPGPVGFLKLTLICLAVFMFGYFWFMRTKKGFADVL
ncbi:MAG TPA: ABC transporter permease [Anaerolineaceae bacterium]